MLPHRQDRLMELDAKLAALEDMSSSELRAARQRLACKVAPRIGGGSVSLIATRLRMAEL